MKYVIVSPSMNKLNVEQCFYEDLVKYFDKPFDEIERIFLEWARADDFRIGDWFELRDCVVFGAAE